MSKGYSIRVIIGGRRFGIVSDDKPEYLEEIAKAVDKSISHMLAENPAMTFEKAAVLSALKFCDDSKRNYLHNRYKTEKNDCINDNLRHQVVEYSKELSRLSQEKRMLEKKIEKIKKEYEEKIRKLTQNT